MAELVSCVAAKLIEVLGCEAIKKVCELWGYQSELAELQQTVSTVRMVLLDADSNWEQLSNHDKDFISRLNDVVYDADDVFDEFRTLAELNQLGRLKKGGKFFAKVRRFFSSENQVGEAYRMSCEVKDIKKRLDLIAVNHKKFELKVDNKPLIKRGEETCSYVDCNDIIGREEDKKVIIDMLLGTHGVEGARFVTIVGVGGLGKTALAQLLFNDEKIKQEFSERLWVCVSDQDEKHFDVKAILCKILEVFTHEKVDCSSSLELVQTGFQQKLKGKKYFLVLDDVWNEDREKWLKLKRFLMLGQHASRVVVTSRSKITASIIEDGDDHAYMLPGLSEKDSWQLFELTAFTSGAKENNHELVDIGKKIVKSCYRIPLAIRVVGSLLFGQEISKWRSLEERGLANLGEDDNGILPILKLSYDNLRTSLKSCFSYCVLFPKDHRIMKENIIGMWMAQGYVVSLDKEEQSVEEAADQHFSILLRRCFFQDVERDEYGDVMSVKIHDLMHDVAVEVVKEEIGIGASVTNKLVDKIRHVNADGYMCLERTLCNKNVRSYIGTHGSLVNAQINNLMRLRVLDLSSCYLKYVPDVIGKLLHLRYLDLSNNYNLELLSESITELYNLQTLDLSRLSYLRELPEGISKLVNLRYLNIECCEKLTYMPSGMDKLTNLRVLPLFIVGYNSITNQRCSDYGMLKDLRALTKIQGTICIKIGDKYSNVEDMSNIEGGYLKSIKYLSVLEIEFKFYKDHKIILDKLEPPQNLKKLSLIGYNGERLGRWGRAEDNWAISLRHLVDIMIKECTNLKEIAVLSKLPYLKSLKLEWLRSVEYMENGMDSGGTSDKQPSKEIFPSLEVLEIRLLSKLKGWWKEFPMSSLIFPRLCRLTILDCPNLTSNLFCPNLKELILLRNSHKLQVTLSTLKNDVVNFKTLAGHLKLQPIHGKEKEKMVEGNLSEESEAYAFSLRFLSITYLAHEEVNICKEEDDNEEEAWKSLSQSLCKLDLWDFRNLPKGIQHLTSLQTLYISHCKMEGGLPEWIGCLSSLQTLRVVHCPGIKSLPESFKNLTSLQNLTICNCPDLEERCRKPDGEDFHKIQHIPQIYIKWVKIT